MELEKVDFRGRMMFIFYMLIVKEQRITSGYLGQTNGIVCLMEEQ